MSDVRIWAKKQHTTVTAAKLAAAVSMSSMMLRCCTADLIGKATPMRGSLTASLAAPREDRFHCLTAADDCRTYTAATTAAPKKCSGGFCVLC